MGGKGDDICIVKVIKNIFHSELSNCYNFKLDCFAFKVVIVIFVMKVYTCYMWQ